VEEPLAARLEWWGNSSIRVAFEVLVTVEESNAELTAHGVLAQQADGAGRFDLCEHALEAQP
jgi:hypothetical protein